MTPLRLAFMGSPDFSVPALRALAEAGHRVAAVYTQPPRPAGRGMAQRACAVQQAAEALGLTVRHPKSLRKAPIQAEFAALEVDCAVVAAYGLILPKPILDAPRLGCVNLHASLLPRWRGAAPIHRAILAGDSETGITLMQMDEGLDTGPMLAREAIPIGPAETAQSLHDRLADLAAEMIVAALPDLAAGRLTATPQPEDGVIYAEKLSRADGELDWSRPAAELDRQLRGLTPWPGAWFRLGGDLVKLGAATIVPGPCRPPGTVLDTDFTVACGEGALRLDRVQRAGRGWTDGAAFLRGSSVTPGDRL